MSHQHTLSALIADSDTLRALGLRHLLRQYYNVESQLAEAEAVMPADFDVCFVSADRFAATAATLMPRASAVVIIGAKPAGADDRFGWLDPALPAEALIDALGAIIAALPTAGADGSAHLSARETEVLSLIASGLINKEIAQRLNISLNTVITHCKNITAKLGIRSRSGLTVYAMINGIV